MSVKKTLIYWRDIPSQVIVQRGRKREKAMLSARFQEAIDRAAMRAGKGSSDAYMSEWERKAEQIDTDADLREAAKADFAEKRGDDFVYEALLGDRAPPLDYRK